MNILISGGLGFIGHNVVRCLQGEHQVSIIDNSTTYGLIPTQELNELMTLRRACILPNKIVHGDICNAALIDDIIESSFPCGYDTIIHLASLPRAKVVNANPVKGSEVMVGALLNLLIAAKKYKIKRFVYVSSSMVYGDFDRSTTEDMVPTPHGTYSILKYAGEQLVKDWCTTNGIEYVIVRPSAVYGPRDITDRVVSKFMSAAMTNKEINVYGVGEILDFTHVDDVAIGIKLAATLPDAANQTYNLTLGQGMSLYDAAKLIVTRIGSRSHIVVNHRDMSFPRRNILSNAKARRELTFNPVIDIDQGFKSYYHWLLSTRAFS